jgi:hypothetical protein
MMRAFSAGKRYCTQEILEVAVEKLFDDMDCPI